jgi:hypothetical protein
MDDLSNGMPVWWWKQQKIFSAFYIFTSWLHPQKLWG